MCGGTEGALCIPLRYELFGTVLCKITPLEEDLMYNIDSRGYLEGPLTYRCRYCVEKVKRGD